VSAIRAISVVAVGLLGLATLASCLPVLRRPSLGDRLHGYLGSLGPRRSGLLGDSGASGRSLTGVAAALRPMLDDLGGRLHRLLGDEGRDLVERLRAAGRDQLPPAFRAEQVAWGLVGFGGGIAGAALLVAAGRSVSPLGALLAAGAFGVAGVMLRDRALTRAVARRRARILAEFPTFVDLVCLAVTAGESLRGALELVAGAGAGPLAAELRRVLRDARTGRPLASALDDCAARIGVEPFHRFVGAVLAAQERGMPLADSLRAMSFDVREAQKRTVIEAAGRKQISMLVPVVGLVLPVAVVFAFFPGVVAIRTLAR
jgi:tight adherence protein C